MTQPKQTIDEGDERAVSPVIGVILMVAITVILAAVIGTFVLDLGQNVQNTGPSASMGFSDADATWGDGAVANESFLLIEHQSGEQLEGDAFRIVVRNVSSNSVVLEYDNGEVATGETIGKFDLNDQTLTSDNTVSVGDIITVRLNEDATVNGVTQQAGFEYSITVVSTDTDNRIATGTVEVN